MTNKKQQGFTLIELLLGLTISILIFLTASSLVVLLFNTDLKSKRTQAIEQAKYLVYQEVSNAIRWAEKIDYTDNQITINDTTIYRFEGGRFTKDGALLTSENVVIENVDFSDYSLDPELKSLEINLELSHKAFPTLKDTFKIVASQRLRSIEQTLESS